MKDGRDSRDGSPGKFPISVYSGSFLDLLSFLSFLS